MRKTTIAITFAMTLLVATGQAAAGSGYYYGCHGNNGDDDLAIALGVTGLVVGTALVADALTRPRQVIVQSPAYYPPSYDYADTASRDYDDGFARGYEAGSASERLPAQRREAVIDYGLGSTGDLYPFE